MERDSLIELDIPIDERFEPLINDLIKYLSILLFIKIAIGNNPKDPISKNLNKLIIFGVLGIIMYHLVIQDLIQLKFLNEINKLSLS